MKAKPSFDPENVSAPAKAAGHSADKALSDGPRRAATKCFREDRDAYPWASGGDTKAIPRRCSCWAQCRHVAGCGSSTAATTSASSSNVPVGSIASDAPEVPRSQVRHDRADRLLADRHRARERASSRSTASTRRSAKGASWAAIRDSLSNGDIQATHMLIGMPIASTMGLLGSPKKPMVIPWLLNRNGQAITLKAELEGQGRGRSRRRSSRSSMRPRPRARR